MPGVVLGYVLAGNPLFDIRALAWALFGLVFHAWGFVQNNIFDYEHDRKDPSKAHHPLMTGEITWSQAVALDMVLLFVMVFGLMGMTLGNPFPQVALMVSIAFGTLYNYRCKQTLLGPLYITASFTSLVFVPYVAYSLTVSLAMWLLIAFAAFLMLFQISVSGYLKDISVTSEVNLLRALGSTLNGGELKLSLQAELYAYTLTVVKSLIIAAITVIVQTSTWAFVAAGLMVAAFLVMSGDLVRNGPYEHDKRVKQMSLVEVLSYFALVFAVEGVLGWQGVTALILLPMVWFMAMNKIMWNRAFTPRV